MSPIEFTEGQLRRIRSTLIQRRVHLEETYGLKNMDEGTGYPPAVCEHLEAARIIDQINKHLTPPPSPNPLATACIKICSIERTDAVSTVREGAYLVLSALISVDVPSLVTHVRRAIRKHPNDQAAATSLLLDLVTLNPSLKEYL